MRKFVLHFEIEDVDDHANPVDPTDSAVLLDEFISGQHFMSHHYFYNDDNLTRAIARLSYIGLEEEDE